MPDKLKPCPFCGGEAKVTWRLMKNGLCTAGKLRKALADYEEA